MSRAPHMPEIERAGDAGRAGVSLPHSPGTDTGSNPVIGVDILHLAELVPIVRERFALPDGFADDAILASLRMIAGHSQPRDRWRAAFASNLGAVLAHAGCDLNTALNTLIALLPRPTS